MPLHPALIPTVTLDTSTLQLHFQSGTALQTLPYRIKDETEQEVQTGTVIIADAEESVVSVALLPSGTYTLEIEVAGRVLVGTFSL